MKTQGQFLAGAIAHQMPKVVSFTSTGYYTFEAIEAACLEIDKVVQRAHATGEGPTALEKLAIELLLARGGYNSVGEFASMYKIYQVSVE